MSDTERGEPDEFEVTWMSGHIDRVKAHQITHPTNADPIFGSSTRPSTVQFHAEVDGRWRLMLSALDKDIRSIRNVTQVGDRFE